MTTEKLTYKQAYDKIIQAYFRDEIKPFSFSFCFCGTLANNNCSWRAHSFNGYNPFEFLKMENALLNTITTIVFGEEKWQSDTHGTEDFEASQNYEAALFDGMSAALEVLKEIHRSRGEDVDEAPVFVKRELVTK